MAINFVPAGTPYAQIHDLAYALAFVDEDGSQGGANLVFGTGWLLDYATDPGADTTTIYLATNLHVADALRSPDDNPEYAYSQADASSDGGSPLGLTTQFYLGRYDDSGGPLSSTGHGANLTYLRFDADNLPKTQYAAVSPDAGQYVDFAVISLSIKMHTADKEATLSPAEEAERDAYSDWISPSIDALDALVNPDGAGAGNYANLFYGAAEGADAKLLDGQSAYVGGYPYYGQSTVAKPYLATTGTSFQAADGSQAFTVNLPNGTTDKALANGQAFDTTDTAAAYGMATVAPGIVDAWTQSSSGQDESWKLSYHGKDYRDFGLIYIADASNIAAGASGSLPLNQDNKILGIYFGTFQDDKGKETGYGLLAPLIVPQSLLDALYRNSVGNGDRTKSGYDLIGGLGQSLGSYRESLQSHADGAPNGTYLFPAAAEGQ